MSSRSFKKAIVAGVACTATVAGVFGAFAVGSAFADPSSTPTVTAPDRVVSSSGNTYVAVGSDTIQSLYDGFANGYKNGAGDDVKATANIASWLATGSPALVPSNAAVPTGANAIGRPANSGDGRAALSAAWNPTNDAFIEGGTTYAVTPHSIDIARSSGKPSVTGNDLESIPLARDAVAVAINGEPTLDNVIQAGTLAALYREPDRTVTGGSNFAEGFFTQSTSGPTAGDVRNNGDDTNVDEQIFDGADWISVHPFLPTNAGSGTRQFFQTAIGGGKNDPAGIGVSAGSSASPIIENTGALVAAKGDIAPFSAAQWIAQQNGTTTNTVTDKNVAIAGIGGLDPVSGTAPHFQPGALYGDTSAAAQGGFGIFDRDVYSVVASQELNADSDLKTLVSVTLPSSPAVSDFGFDPIPAVSADQNNWLPSGFENTGTAPTQATTTSVSVSGVKGDVVTLKATVTGPTGFAIPAGDPVTFSNGTATIGSANTNAGGVATLNYTTTAGAKSFSFTAAYVGHSTPAPAAFAASTSTALAYTTTIAPVDTAGTVKISGTAKVGATLTRSVSGYTSGTTIAQQWKNGSTVLGTGTSLVVPASAYGKTITVTVTAYKVGDVAASATATSAKIAAGTLSAPIPSITGTRKVGYTLTANPGSWTSGTTLKYQWKANGASISKATGKTFKLTSAQAGKKITVTVTGSKTGYTTVAKTSYSTAAVAR